MTLSAQITLIDSIVKKDPDFTIREYLELVKEMDGINGTMEVPIVRESKMNEWVEETDSMKRGRPETPGRYRAKYLRTYKIGS